MTITSEQRPESVPPQEAPRGLFTPYREDQGRHARMAAFWSIVFFVGFGCRFLHDDVLIQWAGMRRPIGGIRIPIVGVDLTPAFLIAATIFLVALFFVQRWLQRPKVADLLIDTEGELKKVTWPKGSEVWNASIIVIISVVVLGAFLALADVFLYRLMRYLILGIS
jgi:preprotein translocase SecE subunit